MRGIESGRECERLAPVLSAFVDGEGDAAQVVDLRVHLRQCLACRAAVRGLHDASRPLAVVFPATGLAVASGGVEQANGLFVRVYETLTMNVHERAANSFVRAQAIVDTVTAGKMAASRRMRMSGHDHMRVRRRHGATRRPLRRERAPRGAPRPPRAPAPRRPV